MLSKEEFFDKVLGLDKRIRFVGIYDSPRVQGKMQGGTSSYLSEFETETSLNQALFRWKARLALQSKIGKPIFSMTKYEKVCRVTMHFEKEAILCFSTEIDVDIIDLINKIIEIKKEAVSEA